jgi:hypothetical protein
MLTEITLYLQATLSSILFFSCYVKSSQNLLEDFYVRPKTVKLIERNTGDIGLDKYFLAMTPKT